VISSSCRFWVGGKVVDSDLQRPTFRTTSSLVIPLAFSLLTKKRQQTRSSDSDNQLEKPNANKPFRGTIPKRIRSRIRGVFHGTPEKGVFHVRGT
jgi:hypothetical protein